MSDDNLPAVIDPSLMVGLDDFEATDAMMPTIRIDHKKGTLKDGLSGEDYGRELEVVILGFVKQRIMWDTEISDDPKPMCKSDNFVTGLPTPKEFPWETFVELGGTKPADADTEGCTLTCESCPMKDWGSHPKNDTPWCSELHTLPLMLLDADGNPSLPAVFTVQRSALKSTRAYITSFAQKKQPLFVVKTKIRIEHKSRGSVDYGVPEFIKGEATDQGTWHDLARSTVTIIDQLKRQARTEAPQGSDDLATDGTAPARPAAPAPAPAAPAQPAAAASAPKAAPVDDDLPF